MSSFKTPIVQSTFRSGSCGIPNCACKRVARKTLASRVMAVCGVGASLLCVLSHADPAFGQRTSRRMYRGMNAGAMHLQGEAGDADDELMDDEAQGPMERESPKIPKTDLARAIMQQDITRDPRSVLGARAKLAGLAREEALKPTVLETAAPGAAASGAGTDGGREARGVSADRPEAAEDRTTNEDAPLAPGRSTLPTREELLAAIPPDMPPEVRAAAIAQLEQALAQMPGDLAESDGLEAPGGDDGVGEPGDGEGDAGATAGGAEAGAEVVPGSGGPGDPAAGTSGVGAADKDKAAEAARKRREKAEKTRKQAEHFRLLIVAGEWDRVGAFIKKETAEDAELVYEWMLSTLLGSDSALVPDEIISLSEASPVEMNDKIVVRLGGLLKATQHRGCQAGAVAARIAQGTVHFGGADPVKRKRAASLLVSAGLPVQAQTYLPPLEQARESKDVELLNLYAVYFAALAREKTGEERERAIDQGWRVSLEALGIASAPARERAKAVGKALAFIGQVPPDTGDQWLVALLSAETDAGWEAIERVNRKCQNLRMQGAAPERRVEGLRTVQRIGKAILSSSPEVLSRWQTGLNMLTLTILEEAETTRQMAASRPRANPWGGYDEYGGDDGQMQPIDAAALGKLLPDAPWLRAIDPGLAAKLELMAAATAGGAGDTQAVLEMIRPIVTSDPERARKLAEALLQAWPNFVRQGSGSTGEDMYGYGGYGGGYARYGGYYGGGGYGGGGGAVPLTRAKQERNLEKLRDAVRALNSLAIGDLPTVALVEAFGASYSEAEVYTREHIGLVFGDIEDIAPQTRLKIAEKMRGQLAGSWRSPQVQEQAGTKRTNEEMNQEVLRGYELAHDLAGAGEDSWERATLQGDLFYDQAEFTYGIAQDTQAYDALRAEAFDQYQRASGLYRSALESGKTKPSARVYVQWFSAALGASDLGYLTRQDRPDLDQVDDVRREIETLGSVQADKHIGLFAQESLKATERMAPELKPKFLRQAVRVMGQHPEAAPALDKLAYYDDLSKEVALAVVLDGPAQVGSNEYFGVHFGVRTTRAVSRATGGFAKYLMNEQWNPVTGQPVNYKDEVEKQIRERWGAGGEFDVAAVTFHKPLTPGVSAGQQGWEFVPLAYVLLKAKDAKTDRLPELKLDMDFSDGGGLVILPVTSAPVPIDARTRAPAQQLRDVTIEQVFDDREAAHGIVRLEVRASGKGVLPPIDQLLTLEFGGELRSQSVEDHGVNIVELDTSTGKIIPVSERTWTVTLEPVDQNAGADRFAFPRPVAAIAGNAKLTNKRYTDADVADAPATISVAALHGSGGGNWPWWLIGGLTPIVVASVWFVRRRGGSSDSQSAAPLFTIPDQVTPMAALSILRRMSRMNGELLRPDQQGELDREIAGLEQSFFSPAAETRRPGEAELRAVVAKWVTQANRA